jgi:hypothetical protein
MAQPENLTDRIFQRNKSKNYVLRATKENKSFVNIYISKIDYYLTLPGGNFNIIIYDKHIPSFFYSIPYSYLKPILTDDGIKYGDFWKAIIDNGIFKIKGSPQRVNVQNFFQNFSGLILDDLTNIREGLETFSQINNDNYSGESVTEGGQRILTVTRYERDPNLKQQALAIHGYNCAICGFNFEQKYGEWGRGFAEIHHIKPLSLSHGEEVLTNPLDDIIVVCSNCHSMIHKKRGTTLSVSELRSKLLRE